MTAAGPLLLESMLVYTLYRSGAYTLTQPKLIYTCMYIRCYESTADSITQEQLWTAVAPLGWMSSSAVPGVIRFYIHESMEFWALIIDPTLRRIPEQDHIV